MIKMKCPKVWFNKRATRSVLFWSTIKGATKYFKSEFNSKYLDDEALFLQMQSQTL